MTKNDANGLISDLIAARKPGFSLDQAFYSDPEVYARDMERVFMREWLYAGHASQIPKPGDYFLFEVAGESVIVVRGDDGEIRALVNVCRHRGSRVCYEKHGNASWFACPYHGWTYDLRGELKAARQMPKDFDLSGSGLATIHAALFHGFIMINFADRPAVRVGADDVWDRAEEALLEAVKGTGLEVQHTPGEGAFYGPKLEFVLRDAIGRDWQCGTLQVDFVLPERLDATYVGEDGERHRPVMLHRAILGSLERFLGILIEHHAGRFPLWLAPRQVVVATITADSDGYAGEVVARLSAAGLNAEADLRNEKIGYKVREHSVAKVPVILAVGAREAESEAVAMRRLGVKEQEILALDEAVDRLQKEAAGPLARTN